MTAAVSNLQPLLTYHFRPVISSPLGTFAGPDATFTTGSTASFTTLDDVPVNTDAFTATGVDLNLSLGFAPPLGSVLTLVNNTGVAPITGTFNNALDGGAVTA